jgi:hypothetical protein
MDFFDRLAMMKLEENHPEIVKRIDELHLKEKSRKIKPMEKTELDRLDRQLLQELDRYRLHYQLNWGQMALGKKAELRTDVENWSKQISEST